MILHGLCRVLFRCPVTHLFQSSDPSQPCIFRGNTRIHDTNVVSTAVSVLLPMLTLILDVTLLVS
ncbi:hypothetical protein BDN67DRAFT_708526 [Paxillus ammoniavirescens]|nr:hypothetical protein BDN67DRAFT_708526 [Paxillus ammoniavirescens]